MLYEQMPLLARKETESGEWKYLSKTAVITVTLLTLQSSASCGMSLRACCCGYGSEEILIKNSVTL